MTDLIRGTTQGLEEYVTLFFKIFFNASVQKSDETLV